MAKKPALSRYSIFHLSKIVAQAIQARNKEIFDKSYFGQLNKLQNNSECKMLKVSLFLLACVPLTHSEFTLGKRYL